MSFFLIWPAWTCERSLWAPPAAQRGMHVELVLHRSVSECRGSFGVSTQRLLQKSNTVLFVHWLASGTKPDTLSPSTWGTCTFRSAGLKLLKLWASFQDEGHLLAVFRTYFPFLRCIGICQLATLNGHKYTCVAVFCRCGCWGSHLTVYLNPVKLCAKRSKEV